jgi:hypothetical protein
MNKLTEGIDYKDFVRQIFPVLSIDEYEAKTGSDDETVTLAFTVKGKEASEDLASWFEKGYDFVLDAQVSKGEVSRGKHIVFVEMERRSKVPERVIEILEDLETLTNLELADWTIKINETEIGADINELKTNIIISPHLYRQSKENETDLNEMRELSGIEPHKIYTEQDSAVKAFKAMAGL